MTYKSHNNLDNGPLKKIILLAGPPGLGKTTLAHVLAEQCGYKPYEINASDDRSAKTLYKRIIDATQSESVLGLLNTKDTPRLFDQRPKCVILDEIDGAMSGNSGSGDKSAIEALLKIVRAGTKPNKNNNNDR